MAIVTIESGAAPRKGRAVAVQTNPTGGACEVKTAGDLVLRTVRLVEESSFVPYLAVNLGIVLALAWLAVLIYFIHHISQSIQAENLIAGVGEDFQLALPVLFPQRIGQEKACGDSSPRRIGAY